MGYGRPRWWRAARCSWWARPWPYESNELAPGTGITANDGRSESQDSSRTWLQQRPERCARTNVFCKHVGPMSPDQYPLLSSRPAHRGQCEFWLSARRVSTSERSPFTVAVIANYRTSIREPGVKFAKPTVPLCNQIRLQSDSPLTRLTWALHDSNEQYNGFWCAWVCMVNMYS